MSMASGNFTMCENVCRRFTRLAGVFKCHFGFLNKCISTSRIYSVWVNLHAISQIVLFLIDNVRILLDKHADLDLYSASSLQQQSVCRHVAQLGHIILILRQPGFALNAACLADTHQIPIY